MQPFIALLLSSLALVSAGGAVLPADSADGVYAGFTHSNGTIEYSLISARSDGEVPYQANSIEQRALPVSDSRCVAYGFNYKDYEAAFNSLAQWCDDGNQIKAGGWITAKYSSAMVYACSYGGRNPCSSGEMRDFHLYIEKKCGQTIAGWVKMDDWAKTYGRDAVSASFC
jgi:hypothetical protein